MQPAHPDDIAVNLLVHFLSGKPSILIPPHNTESRRLGMAGSENWNFYRNQGLYWLARYFAVENFKLRMFRTDEKIDMYEAGKCVVGVGGVRGR